MGDRGKTASECDDFINCGSFMRKGRKEDKEERN